MKSINKFLKLLSEQTGYMNYMEDRYLISGRLSQKIENCRRRFNPQTPQLRISFYKCQLLAYKTAVDKFEAASEKCRYARMPEHCERFYQNIIDSLNRKIQFYNDEIPNILRQINKTKY